eukprot:scaffold91823_cov66-Phaeocystis_antarctica.AAC.2
MPNTADASTRHGHCGRALAPAVVGGAALWPENTCHHVDCARSLRRRASWSHFALLLAWPRRGLAVHRALRLCHAPGVPLEILHHAQ